MDYKFPSYQKLFEVTKRRLKGLKNIASKSTGKLTDQDAFMFMIIGNINLRFNTICMLLESNNYDGIFVLQRSIFELQLAFEAYMKAHKKEEFLKLYSKKSNFETVNKWQKLIERSNEDQADIFTQEDQEKIEDWKSNIIEDLDIPNNRDRMKLWYELATNKSVKELSYEYLSALDYFISYDEPSNWVHPQRLEENINSEFDNTISLNYMIILIGMLRADINWIRDDITEVAKYVGLSTSDRLYKHLNDLVSFDKKLIEIGTSINENRKRE
ncbi:DUF5677 domain-containing protein [Enterococcus gallinarum]|uniref:DUF5677 domain-containing protein n=1 Tax=Enterococcus gallinarum TaxID=1353 RepID=A0AAE4HS89_ENTGA|nr:DUF5677 domain-containing protein [Enterococcus gallinarum]MDT2691494.1 DUF5677 domain-containing protein [Enterococcus gallinarum]